MNLVNALVEFTTELSDFLHFRSLNELYFPSSCFSQLKENILIIAYSPCNRVDFYVFLSSCFEDRFDTIK